MKILVLLVALFVLGTHPVFAQSDLQRSHIEANVPPPEEFERLLHRDLLAFFKQSVGASVTSIEVQPLRSGPTQSGVSYPKFYLWVKVMAGSSVQQAGAVRVAAVQRMRFEITDFMAAASIKANTRNRASCTKGRYRWGKDSCLCGPTCCVPIVSDLSNI